jgi:transposase
MQESICVLEIAATLLRHRIYQAGFMDMVKAIGEKCFERRVPAVKVNPENTSSRCPSCGSKLMRGQPQGA